MNYTFSYTLSGLACSAACAALLGWIYTSTLWAMGFLVIFLVCTFARSKGIGGSNAFRLLLITMTSALLGYLFVPSAKDAFLGVILFSVFTFGSIWWVLIGLLVWHGSTGRPLEARPSDVSQ